VLDQLPGDAGAGRLVPVDAAEDQDRVRRPGGGVPEQVAEHRPGVDGPAEGEHAVGLGGHVRWATGVGSTGRAAGGGRREASRPPTRPVGRPSRPADVQAEQRHQQRTEPAAVRIVVRDEVNPYGGGLYRIPQTPEVAGSRRDVMRVQ
jgi:hypothetical protein